MNWFAIALYVLGFLPVWASFQSNPNSGGFGDLVLIVFWPFLIIGTLLMSLYIYIRYVVTGK